MSVATLWLFLNTYGTRPTYGSLDVSPLRLPVLLGGRQKTGLISMAISATCMVRLMAGLVVDGAWIWRLANKEAAISRCCAFS